MSCDNQLPDGAPTSDADTSAGVHRINAVVLRADDVEVEGVRGGVRIRKLKRHRFVTTTLWDRRWSGAFHCERRRWAKRSSTRAQ